VDPFVSLNQSRRSYRSLATMLLGCGCVLGALMTVLGAAAAPATEPISTPSTELEFELEDQFGRRYDSSEFADKRLILVGGNREASNDTRAWALEALKLIAAESAPNAQVELLRVADLRAVPAGFRGLVAKKMRRKYETPVLMDWQGVLADRFEFQSGLANVVIVDELGVVHLLLQAQQPQPRQVDQLKKALAALGSSESGGESASSPTGISGSGLKKGEAAK